MIFSFLSITRAPPKPFFLDFLAALETSLVFLSLLLCFLPSLFLLATPLSLLWFSQRKKTQEALFLFHTHGFNTKRKKSSHLFTPFHTYGSNSKEKGFLQFFSSFCSQLKARVILTLSLQESMSRVRGKCNSFSLLFILNLSDSYTMLFMNVLDSRDCWLPKYELNHCYACMCF